MLKKPSHIELLCPAGNFEKLKTAVHYGADAVYLSGQDFSLRNLSKNFSIQEMEEAVTYAHDRNVRVYVACNIYARNHEIDAIERFLTQLGRIHPDAAIISDPGIISMARSMIPHIPMHLSTQTNTTNLESAKFWKSIGIARINLARELSLPEIKQIADQVDMEFEIFVHGAMCISYSGRCILSSFMANRESNRGMCCHPCRWKYHLVEELRPNEYYPVLEDNRGTYIMNSKDICLIEHIPECIEAGIASLKIEGRMKGINYLASATKVYRQAIDEYYNAPETYKVKDEWIAELSKIDSRCYTTGFYFEQPDQVIPNFENIAPQKGFQIVGKILSKSESNRYRIEVRNKITLGDSIEVLPKKGRALEFVVDSICDDQGQLLELVNNGQIIDLNLPGEFSSNDIIRKKLEKESSLA